METTQTKGSSYAWLILVACIGFYALPVGIIGNTSGIFVTPVMDEFGWSRTEATLYMTIQPWIGALVTPFAGRFLAKYNPRWLLTASVLIYGLATIWTAFATEPWQWHTYGVIYGITCAFFMFLAAPTLISAWFTKGAGLAMGIAGAALSLIAAIASPIGQNLIANHGWQFARLWMGVVMTLGATLLTVLFVRKSPASMGVLPWGAGTVDLTKGAAPAVVDKGATLGQAKKAPAFYLLMLVAGLLVMGASFFQQIPSYAADGSLGATAGATAVSIIMVGAVVGKFLLGWMSDQFGSRATGVIAGSCGFVGLLLAFIAGSSVMVFYVGMGLFGVAFAALTIVSPMLTRQAFGTANYSEIYSWVSTSIFVFSGLAALVYAQIYDLTGSLSPAFILVMVFYVIIAIAVPYIASSGPKAWKSTTSRQGEPVG